MQKRTWGIGVAAVALTCLAMTGCGTMNNHSSSSVNTLGTAQTKSSNPKQHKKDKVESHPQSTTVSSPSFKKNPTKTNIFLGKNVRMIINSNMPKAISNGYTDQQTKLTYSKNKFQAVESFTGILNNKTFILDFYKSASNGIAVGISYNHQPVYFGWGPSPVFDILHFVGDNVLLGSPSAGAYMAINLVNGQLITNTEEIVALKGYSGLQPPKYILGLPGTHYSIQIPN
ncbi:hypothetical protein [Sulfoacidibacillus thermotolerans]|uniref:hypothetical protein n=1 Tax=Sulfoacidibacillus thermotolerans TaxID=1765684 RepID=UPI001C62F39D|nr:hypothetical protein [Sulfoacidibacillus thermotolerans]